VGTKVNKNRHRHRDGQSPVSVRRCLVKGIEQPKTKLIRFVVGPDDCIVPDLEERLPGRGLWLSADRDVLNTASSGRVFAKAARRRVEMPIDLADSVETLLLGRVKDLIGLARRSGNVVNGFEKVRAFLKAGRKGIILAARDGARGGREKLVGNSSGRTELDVLDSFELGQALGREKVVHAVVASGPLAERIHREMGRLEGVRFKVEHIEVGE
jgi:predicted RNA-binding protein YlxR (DUF448 family)